MQRTVPVWLLFLVLHSKLISGSTLLRTAVISRGAPSELEWCAMRLETARMHAVSAVVTFDVPLDGPACTPAWLIDLRTGDGLRVLQAQQQRAS